jgi:hypothetical protein
LPVALARLKYTALLLFLVAVQEAGAGRVQFAVMVGEDEVGSDAQVCIYRSSGFGNPDPLPKYFSSNDVRCFPGDKIIAFPEGHWSYFVHVGDTRVAHGGMLKVRGAAEHGFQRLVVPTSPAVAVDFSDVTPTLRPDEFIVVYMPSIAERFPAALPLPRGAETLLVPRGSTWIPVVTNGKTIVRVGELRREVAVPVRIPSSEFLLDSDTYDLLAWLHWHGDTAEKAYAINNPSPTLTITGKTGSIAPISPAPRSYSDGLIIFKRLPRTSPDRRLQLQGDFWEGVQMQLPDVGADRQVVIVGGVVAKPAAVVEVAWEPEDVDDLLRAARTSCASEAIPDAAAMLNVDLARCDGIRADLAPREIEQLDCKRMANAVAPLQGQQSVALSGIPAGEYRLRLQLGELPASYSVVSALPGRRLVQHLSESYQILWGRITRAGEPVAASIQFRTGRGISDAETGQYVAIVAGDPGQGAVNITPCESGWRYRHFPTEPVLARVPFDIDIPANEVIIHVRERSSKKPVADADTVVIAMDRKNDRRLLMRHDGGRTNASGTTVIESVMPNNPLRACASREGYETSCEEFEIDHSSSVEIALDLRSRAVRKGRVVTKYPLQDTAIAFVTPHGVVTETADVSLEGDFTFAREHGPDEHLVLFSRAHPLVALRQPAPSDQILKIEVPEFGPRAFTVLPGSGSSKDVQLVQLDIGGLIVPSRAFKAHQMLRGSLPTLAAKDALQVRDVLGSGPIGVTIAPAVVVGVDSPSLQVACNQPQNQPFCVRRLVPSKNELSFD